MQFFRSLIFSFVMFFGTFLIAIASAILIFFPFHTRAKYMRPYSQFNIWALKRICGIRYKVIGMENLPTGSYIIFSNHQSTWETFVLQLIFPPVAFVIKKELLYVPFFGWALALLKPISIKRSSGREALKQLIKQGIERLNDNIIVVIFPEGTRIPPTEKVEFKKGGAILAEKSGYPVVPVAHNAGYYWPKRGFLKKKGLITIHIGKAIQTEGRKAKDIMDEAEAFITTHIEPAKFK